MTNVLIVDDERTIQELFAFYISTASDRYTIVDTVRNAANATLICHRSPVDLILMDVCTSGNESGLAAAKHIKEQYPGTKVIIVTSAPEHSFIERAKEAGADSFWYKESSELGLLDIMDRTMAGESIYPTTAQNVTVGLCDSRFFTPKELDVLRYVMEGYAVTEIADKMQVDYDTTRTHLRHLKEKTGARNITELAIMVSKSRLIIPEY